MNGYLVLGLVQYLYSEEGLPLSSQQPNQKELSREIAVYRALVIHTDIEGANFAGARRKLMGKMCRPADINLVEQVARKLRDAGYIVMDGQKLSLNGEKVTDRIVTLVQGIEGNDPSFRNLNEGLRAQIFELADELKAMSQGDRLTPA